MSEENLEQNNVSEQKVVEPSPIEKKAMEMGWKPKEHFSGNEEDFIDAKEFVARQPLYDTISHTKRELRQLKDGFEALKSHYTNVRDFEYKRALETLKKERQTAITNGDGERFTEIDDEIKQVEEQRAKLQETATSAPTQEVAPEFQRFVNANPWYSNVKYMREFADEFGLRLHNQGMAPSEVLKEVEKAVRKEFPQKFSNPNKEQAPNVEAGSKGGASAKRESFKLTAQEEQIFATLHKSDPKTFTREKYIEQIKAVRGVE